MIRRFCCSLTVVIFLCSLMPPAEATPIGFGSMRLSSAGSPSLTVGGQIKLDAFLDAEQTFNDLPAFATPASYLDANGNLQPNASAAHQSMNLGVRETFLDLAFQESLSNSWQLEGDVETNFLGYLSSGVDASSPTPVLRYAYAQLHNSGPFALAFGQLQGPFSPLDPPALNGNLFGYAGNLSSRLPQVRVQYGMGDWSLAAAAVRPADLAVDTRGSGFDLVGHGQDSGTPELQGRIAWHPANLETPYGGGEQPAELGLSGRYAQEAFYPGTTAEQHFPSWGVSLEGLWPLGDRFWASGELYRGHNLDNVYGLSGVAGTNTAAGSFAPLSTVPETGGWTALGMHVLSGIDAHLIYGLAAPDAASFAKSGFHQDSSLDVTRNEGLTGNLLWHCLQTTTLGFEISRINTAYVPLAQGGTRTNGTLDRLQFSFIQGF